jgi:hypothetical protein
MFRNFPTLVNFQKNIRGIVLELNQKKKFYKKKNTFIGNSEIFNKLTAFLLTHTDRKACACARKNLSERGYRQLG